MKKRYLAAVGAAVLFATAATSAEACPNWQLAPPFGDVQINAGQLFNRAFNRYVGAGGSYNLAQCFPGYSWYGYAAAAPDFDLYYYGGGYDLTFEVESQYDTILLINAPDGLWYYADDVYGYNPAMTFYNAQSGLYDVWVGTYDPGHNRPSTLYIYEN